MDCEKFDRVLMDLLYGELDELTRAAAMRHSDQCSRCRDVFGGLNAARDLAVLPVVEPPDGFESRIMEAENQVRRRMPARQRLSRAVTILSGYAMRPQLAMAALLMLMIGSSLILLRAKPGSYASNMEVTESGVPLKEDSVVVPIDEQVAQVPPPELASAKVGSSGATESRPSDETAPKGQHAADTDESPIAAEAELDVARAKAEDDAFNAAMASYRSGQLLTAQKQFDEIVQVGGRHASASELLAAQAVEKAMGCPEALARFDSVAANHPADVSHTAIWHSANCRKEMGQDRRALLDFEKLLQVPTYAAQARQAVAELEAVVSPGPVLAEARRGKASPAKKSATPRTAASKARASKKSASGFARSPPRVEAKAEDRAATRAPAKAKKPSASATPEPRAPRK